MLKKKYEDLLNFMEPFFSQEGYQKQRKKGEYCRHVANKIIKIKIVLGATMRGGTLGEVRVFVALEYPQIEKLVSALKQEPYKNGSNIFCQDIDLFCGENSYHAFNFFDDSNMEYIGNVIKEILFRNIFLKISKYEDDKYIIKKFECEDTSWRKNYFSGGHADINFYLRWISLCVINGYIRETLKILENIPTFYDLDKDVQNVKKNLEYLCRDKKQSNSFYLLINNKIRINPTMEKIKKNILMLDGLNVYYLILENTSNGYLQIAGGPGEFVVEIRIYDDTGDNHYRAEKYDYDDRMKKILYGSNYMELQVRQVLSIYQVFEIVDKYILNQELHESYNWIKLNL